MSCVVLAALVCTASAPARETESDKLRAALVGTWEITTPAPAPGLRQVKHVTPTHYTWVTYEAATGVPVATAGGTWTIADGKFVQKCEFAVNEPFRGKETVFTVKIEGDKWYHAGVLATGFRVDETWTRLPAEAAKKSSPP